MYNSLKGRDLYTVYRVKFPNGKSYIGFTEVGILERKRTHYSSINSKKRTPMKNALKKYKGRETWEVLNCYETLKLALKMESVFIEKYDSTNTGYNVQTGGQYCPPTRVKKGTKVIDYQGNIFESAEEAAKFYKVTASMVLASCREGYVVKDKTIFRKHNNDFVKKGIICLETGEYYINTGDVCRKLGFKKSAKNSITRAISGERSSYKGYTFLRYEPKYESLIGCKFKIIRPKTAHNKITEVYDSKGNKFSSIKEAASFYKISPSNVFYSIKQSKTLEMGIKFSNCPNIKAYEKLIKCHQTEELFENVRQISKALNIDYSYLSKSIKNNKKAKGYSFEYVLREV